MIRINLLAVERQAKKKKATFQSGQKVAVGCAFILILFIYHRSVKQTEVHLI